MGNITGGIFIKPAVNMNAEKMSDEQIDIFQRAFADILGVEFIPLIYVGSQVVAGVLHSYIASRRPIHPASQTTLVKVVIYQNLEHVVSLHSIADI
ncbi:hypothetical protein [Enterobacter wuhouensis]|uniref:Uncharacterized protein n=1 Tax=Enterobacter wuhouensis TaxID=2529381 RepID=A0A4R0GGW8_9ENTR|nr:hypothetical protein [Enterobacter wuhouensis]TCB94669.1 hypothetical protein E0L20_00920 [Enterobacter wuhouensis]WRW29880.1 hypothetical protein VPX56_13785 [Enterobacter wuhouensis]